jgi:hypothetical protein
VRHRLACAATCALLSLGAWQAAYATPPDPRPDHTRLPPLSVAGAPRSLVTLVVAVPAEVQEAARLRYEVQVSGSLEVLGRLDGELQRGIDGRFRPVLLTLRVPSDALVGLLDVAEVLFVADDGRVVVVPIVLRVPSVRDSRLSGAKEVRDLRPGDRLELAFQVRNLGNAPETFDVDIKAPTDWSVRARESRTVTVPAFGAADVNVGLRIPPFLNAGSFAVTVGIRRAGSGDTTLVASARTSLRIREAERKPEGLLFRPFVALTATGNGTGVGSGMQLSGPLNEKVRLRAQVTPLAPVGGPEMFGLAAVGAMRMPFQASLASEHWNVDVGNALIGFSELTGVNVGGQGVSATVRRENRQATAVVARPAVGTGASGQIVGAGAWVDHELGRFGGSLSYLSEERVNAVASRRLTAFGADWVSRPLAGSVVSAGLALREFGAGTSVGYRAQLLRETEADRVRLSVLHAPGGSRAFALATDQLQLEARRVISDRVSVNAAGTATRDAGGFFDELKGSAFSIGPRVQLTRRSALTVQGATQRNSARAAAGTVGGFGAHRRVVNATYQTGIGRWDLMADGSLSALTRETQLFSGGTDARTALQRGVSFSASRAVRDLGQIAAGTTITQTGAGVGQPGSASSTFARWGGIPLLVAGHVLRADQEVRVVQTSFDGARLGLRTGVSTALRSGFDVIASLERNPFVRDAQGRQGWIFALKLSASTAVLSSSPLQTPGVVFEDRNGNGRRDAGEPGIAGVALRYDNLRIVTAKDGTYRMPASMRGRVRVDPATIPNGVVAHPRFALDSLERRDIPLVPTGTRGIELRIENDADGRAPIVDLSQADVWLRDADDFEWVGRSVAGGRFVFEHVPAGEYALRLSFERLPEQVRADEVRVRVEPGTNADLVVPVRGRSVRIITPPRSNGRGGVGPRNGRGVMP